MVETWAAHSWRAGWSVPDVAGRVVVAAEQTREGLAILADRD
jgi:hypothetical protein